LSLLGRYRDTLILDPAIESIDAYRLTDGVVRAFPSGQLTIGGFGERSAPQVAIWRGLVKPHRPDELWFDCSEKFLKSYLPLSLHDLAFLSNSEAWNSLRGGQSGESFALVQKEDRTFLAILGLPTEEGLELVLDSLLKTPPTGPHPASELLLRHHRPT
jgi:hypothetical protein